MNRREERERERAKTSLCYLYMPFLAAIPNGLQSPTVRFVKPSNISSLSFICASSYFSIRNLYAFGGRFVSVGLAWQLIALEIPELLRYLIQLLSVEFLNTCRQNFLFRVRLCLVAGETVRNESEFLSNQVSAFHLLEKNNKFLWFPLFYREPKRGVFHDILFQG